MFQIGDKVKVKEPDTEIKDERLAPETVNILKALNFIGYITDTEDDLYFVGFADEKLGWVTQMYNADEIEEV